MGILSKLVDVWCDFEGKNVLIGDVLCNWTYPPVVSVLMCGVMVKKGDRTYLLGVVLYLEKQGMYGFGGVCTP